MTPEPFMEGLIFLKAPLAALVLKIVLCLLFTLGSAVTVTLPYMLGSYVSFFYGVSTLYENNFFITAFLMTSGFLGLWIILELILMLNTISKNPFTTRNSNALRRISFVAIAASALFFIKCITNFTLLTLLCGFVLLIAALFALTLSALFYQAAIYKQDSDLTI